ncbi:hypothetical protein MAPG_11372 [Magnaporthiopsis poae ATCC 64411]|uniref:Nephrocystin 3-like N-terminal domain-containing protein n=1 Tax=Magnaporthiopsis poae (strain ATCC 64411 / 73-15) TaxID=644358 RepID=A0A0C4EF37_MAGP6|nr:hypothetical protein MAPG_11372 [Magnaporthiopsis poae ATCC 64411]
MAASVGEHGDTIYNLAGECEELFLKIHAQLKAVAADVIDLFEEYQHRFLAWTAYLGVFAKRSVCLDQQLIRHPEIQDLVVRVLGILQLHLEQISVFLAAIPGDAGKGRKEDQDTTTETGLAPELDSSLKAIHGALDRLNRYGVLIRRSSKKPQTTCSSQNDPAKNHFKQIMLGCVQALYPSARIELQEYLAGYMATRRNEIVRKQSRHEIYQTHRSTLTTPLDSIPEHELSQVEGRLQPPASGFTDSQQGRGSQGGTASGVLGAGPHRGFQARHSEHSSINSFLFHQQRNERPSDFGSERNDTSSIHGRRVGYPKPPQPGANSNFIKCEWCAQTQEKAFFDGPRWISHVDSDFEPYLCLAESCSQPDRGFPTRKKWQDHMFTRHGMTWYQEVFPPWECAVCRRDSARFNKPEELDTHLKDEHGFTEIQREAIVDQSLSHARRNRDTCLLCCLPVKKDEASTSERATRDMGQTEHGKRKHGSPSPHSSPKRVRMDDGSIGGPSSAPTNSRREIAFRNVDPDPMHGELMSKHIARHLQALMVLGIRFMANEKVGDDAGEPGGSIGTGTAESGDISTRETLSLDGSSPNNNSVPGAEPMDMVNVQLPRLDTSNLAIHQNNVALNAEDGVMAWLTPAVLKVEHEGWNVRPENEGHRPDALGASMAAQVNIHEQGLTVLHQAAHPKIDIVFVHGFTGHPKNTWAWQRTKHGSSHQKGEHDPGEEASSARRLKILEFGFGKEKRRSSPIATSSFTLHPSPDEAANTNVVTEREELQEEVYWPKDLAPTTVPDSRIFTYGYDTHIRNWIQGPISKKNIHDHGWNLLCSLEKFRRGVGEASRPILFIAHSLGGIVVKEALRKSRRCAMVKPHLHAIHEATTGLIFFGTPHRGADPRSFLHHVLTASVQSPGFKVNQQIVDALMPNNPYLQDLSDEFAVLCLEREWPVYSFQEEYGVTQLMGTKVVDDRSSCLDDIRIETKWHISRNHMDMCRFSGFEDTQYTKVAGAMRSIIGRAATCDSRRETPFQAPQPESSMACNQSQGIDAEMKEDLVKSLFFPQIDQRLTGLAAAQGKTCRWFLAKQEYRAWRDLKNQSDDSTLLWIKGNPGTGKSTLMKFLFEETRGETKGDSLRITLSFFFRARGTIEEISTVYLYRSLLYQLFQSATDLSDSLEWMMAPWAKRILDKGWDQEALKQTLKYSVSRLGRRPLTILIDALDESDQTQVADMVSFFEELCEHAMEARVSLRICFSSRHYPTIAIQRGAELILEHEEGHKDDIEQFIKSRLRLGNLGKTAKAAPLRDEIRDKSSGIFLWVVLIVDILNQGYLNGTASTSISINNLRNRLQEIPPGLHELFEMILARDSKNLNQLHLCLKWVLFAARPLKPPELYFAIQLGIDKDNSSHWDREDIGEEQLRAFVRSCSKGMAEVTRNKASKVQFIHESVRDFLLGRYGEQWSGTSGNIVGYSHNVLKDCCLAQLNSSFRQTVDIPDEPPKDAEAAKSIREALQHNFPFLEYAVSNALRHADSAQQHGVAQETLLKDFPLSKWAVLSNALERYAVRRYTKSVGLPYILAEKNLAHLIRILAEPAAFFSIGDERYGPPIFAALAMESHDAVEEILRGIQQTHQVLQYLPPSFQDLAALYHQNKGLGSELSNQLSTRAVFSRQRTVGSYLRPDRMSDGAILLAYISLGQLSVDITLLFWAAAHGYDKVIQFLLDTEQVDINGTDHVGRTPLSWAAANGHQAVVQLLLDTGKADADSKDNNGWTPLSTPLSWAAANGHKAVVQLLLDTGKIDADSKDHIGRTPLSWAAANGHQAVVQLLLDTGKIDADSKDARGQTPLSWAARRGRQTIVQLLLDTGKVDADSRDYTGTTPISWAVALDRQGVVQLLQKYINKNPKG